MLKITLKEPIPDGLQAPNSLGGGTVEAQYARTMQVIMANGNVESLRRLVLRENPLPMDDTWFEFTRGNGVVVFVPGGNIAFIDVVE